MYADTYIHLTTTILCSGSNAHSGRTQQSLIQNDFIINNCTVPSRINIGQAKSIVIKHSGFSVRSTMSYIVVVCWYFNKS